MWMRILKRLKQRKIVSVNQMYSHFCKRLKKLTVQRIFIFKFWFDYDGGCGDAGGGGVCGYTGDGSGVDGCGAEIWYGGFI